MTLAELAAEPFIVREPGSGTRETAEEALRAAGLSVRLVMELASNGAIKRAVAQDLGVSILSRYATALEIQIGHLVELPVVGLPAAPPVAPRLCARQTPGSGGRGVPAVRR